MNATFEGGEYVLFLKCMVISRSTGPNSLPAYALYTIHIILLYNIIV